MIVKAILPFTYYVLFTRILALTSVSRFCSSLNEYYLATLLYPYVVFLLAIHIHTYEYNIHTGYTDFREVLFYTTALLVL